MQIDRREHGKLIADMTRRGNVPPVAPVAPISPVGADVPVATAAIPLDLREDRPRQQPMSRAERRAARRESRLSAKPRQDPSPNPRQQPFD